jgi:hypothetical protein
VSGHVDLFLKHNTSDSKNVIEIRKIEERSGHVIFNYVELSPTPHIHTYYTKLGISHKIYIYIYIYFVQGSLQARKYHNVLIKKLKIKSSYLE